MEIKNRTRKVYTNEILWFNVIDGDTVQCMIDLGYNMYHKIMARLDRIDAPETRKKNLTERIAGEKVKDLVNLILSKAFTDSYIYLDAYELIKHDGRGRVIADIWMGTHNRNMSSILIQMGVARPYDGAEARGSWTEEELVNISKKCDEISQKINEGKWEW